MANIWLPAETDIALALREPNLLVPGKKPVVPVELRYDFYEKVKPRVLFSHALSTIYDFSYHKTAKANFITGAWTYDGFVSGTEAAHWQPSYNNFDPDALGGHVFLAITFRVLIATGNYDYLLRGYIGGAGFFITLVPNNDVRITELGGISENKQLSLTANIGDLITVVLMQGNSTTTTDRYYIAVNHTTNKYATTTPSAGRTSSFHSGSYTGASTYDSVRRAVIIQAIGGTTHVSFDDALRYAKNPFDTLLKPANSTPYLFPVAGGGGAAYDETFSASASSAFTLADSWTLNYAETFGASAASGAEFTDSYQTPSVNYDETFAASAASGTELTDAWSLDYSETFAATAASGATLTDAWLLNYAETLAAGSAAAFTLTDAWSLNYAETFAASAASGCDLAHSYAVGSNYTETFAASSVSVATLTHDYSVQYSETFAAMALADCTLVAAWELDYAETFAAAAASGAVFTEAYETPAPGVFDETFSALAVSACDLTHAFSTPAAIGRVINPTLAARGAPMRTLKGLKLIN